MENQPSAKHEEMDTILQQVAQHSIHQCKDAWYPENYRDLTLKDVKDMQE